jgi:hypothetical protein
MNDTTNAFDLHKICQKMFLVFCGWWVKVSILELMPVLIIHNLFCTLHERLSMRCKKKANYIFQGFYVSLVPPSGIVSFASSQKKAKEHVLSNNQLSKGYYSSF